MLGRAAAVFLLSFIAVTNAVFGQCSYQPVSSYQFRSSILDVAADSLDILAANGYGIALYGAQSGAPTLTTTLPLAGPTRVVRRFNGNAYAGSGTSIVLVLISHVPAEGPATGLSIGGSVDAGATVNDILPAGSKLYAATSKGVQQYDITNPLPGRTAAAFATSGTNTTSLAIDANTLYVADSDSTIEVFSIVDPANPQKLGTITSLPRTTSVTILDGYLFASDGVQTDIFLLSGATATKIATVPFGTTSLEQIADNVVAIAGSDRRLHIVDIGVIGSPVELFATDLLPSGGTINRIGAISLAGNKLYVAAGDIGLAVYDLAAFQPPYPLRSYASGATSSIVSTQTRIYAALSSGGIVELSQAASGAVTKLRQWSDGVSTVHDVAGDFLLSSSGSTLTYWTLTSTTPVPVSTVSFSAPVTSAVAVGTNAYVILNDQTLWLADLAQVSPAPRQLGIAAQHPGLVARSGSSLAIADLRDDGTTGIINFRNGSTLEIPRTANVAGVATAFAHSGNLVAVFTFRGVTVVDLSSGSQTVMSGSTSTIPTSLALDGTNVLATTSSGLTVWNARTGALVRTIPLPSNSSRVAVPEPADGFAAVATSDGITSVAYTSQSQLPALLSIPNGNAYYKKVLAAKNRLYLFDGRGVDLFETVSGHVPHYLNRIAPPGIIDIAATDRGVFALTNNGTVYSYAPDGTPITQRVVASTDNDTTPLSINAVGGAPWVSASQGCRTGTCQNNTFVLDPQSLVTTATLSGAVTEVTTSGSRAYAITTLPAEVRVLDVADPLHPTTVVSRAVEGTNAPVSIAYASGTVLVLGEKLYSYAEATLVKLGEQAVAFDPTTYPDQQILVSGGCGIVTGRVATPALYGVPSLAPAGSIPVPALVKSVASSGTHVYLLTEDSLEIWANGAAQPAPRHRAVR